MGIRRFDQNRNGDYEQRDVDQKWENSRTTTNFPSRTKNRTVPKIECIPIDGMKFKQSK